MKINTDKLKELLRFQTLVEVSEWTWIVYDHLTKIFRWSVNPWKKSVVKIAKHFKVEPEELI